MSVRLDEIVQATRDSLARRKRERPLTELLRQVTVDRGATRFCPNMHEHGHFHCDVCGTVFDVDLPGELPGLPLPRGFKPQRYEVAIHGVCAECAKKLKS